mmetsp:Transcript_54199/g.164098  ORF Transcript_54199/g.164098 Transcript_54199/m.164098 type:complete len:199 (-) Transcript_54199:51-647(-)
MRCGDDAHNETWINAVRAARTIGCVHGGWAPIVPQSEKRQLTPGTDQYADEEGFMQAHGYDSWWRHWEQAQPWQVGPGARPNAWQEVLLNFGLVQPSAVAVRLEARGGRSPKEEARQQLINGLSKGLAYGDALPSAAAAAAWVDAFLAPLQDLEDSAVQYWTGNADTATINTGVVYVIGSPDGGDGSSVGCLWFGDED